MKLSVLSSIVSFGTLAYSSAWTTTTNTRTINGKISRSTPLAMASKSSAKVASRSKWAESRGVSDDNDQQQQQGSEFCTIIGGGRIGSLLVSSTTTNTLLLKRGDAIPSDNEGTPIFIATRNDSLDGIIAECPPNRLADLVFLQNGYLDSYLESKGLMDNTQALLYLSVPALGVDPVDGITAVNPEGLTSATGVHAKALADLLESLNLKCNVVSMKEYKPAMFEKLIWIATYMLVGTAKECSSVGEAGAQHAQLVETVVNELISAVSSKEGVTFQDGSMERLAAYTDVVADFPCAVKEFEWRNEYFYKLGDEACPTHNGLLRECEEKGFLGFNLP